MVHENVGKIRAARGVTKTHMANALDVSLQNYRYLENGTIRLDVERLKVIARILSVDEAVFFDDKLTESVVLSLQGQLE